MLHFETFNCNLCATAFRNMYNMVGFVKPFNFRCETSFTKIRTAFYFRNDRSGDTTSWNHFVKPVRGAVAHKFQLKVSTCNSGFTYCSARASPWLILKVQLPVIWALWRLKTISKICSRNPGLFWIGAEQPLFLILRLLFQCKSKGLWR